MNKTKNIHPFFITLVLCFFIVSILLPGVNIAAFGAISTGVLDSTSDTSITNSETSKKYTLVFVGNNQDFLVTAVYGPSPCTPVSEGGSGFYAISITPMNYLSERYVNAPKAVSYKIEFRDFQGNVLKTISNTKEIEYYKTGDGNNKKIVGWIYGFFKPGEFKDKIGERGFRMAYQIWFADHPSNGLKFDLLANTKMPLVKKPANRGLIAGRAGSIQTEAGKTTGNVRVAPAQGMALAGLGISPRAGGGVTAGYGVDMISGALTDYAVDMALPDGLSVARYYNSAMGYQPGRCFGWMFNFEEFLRFDPDGSIFYRQYDFREYRFTPDANAADIYAPAKAGNFLKMTRDKQGNYEITFKNQSKKVFDPNGRLIKITDKNGNAVTYAWEAPGSRQKGTYDVPAKLLKVMGPADIFRANQTLKITNPYGRSITVAFNAIGRVNTITDWSGRSVQYFWDDIQGIYLLKFKNTGGDYIEYTSTGSAYNQVTGVKYPNGVQVANSYLSTSSPNSQIVSYQDNSAGGKVTYNYGWLSSPQQNWTTVNRSGKITSYYYGENGSIAKIEKPGANNATAAITFAYYADKNLLKSVTNPLGQTVSYVYDARGNVAETKFPDGKTVKYAYNDKTDSLTDFWDTRGRRTRYNYDGKDNLISVDRSDGSKVSFTYDSRGRLTKTTDENGNSITYEYGTYGDLSKITDEEGGAITYYRDSLGRTVTIEANGAKTNMAYDGLDRVTRVTDALGRNTNISYDGNGNVTSVTNPLGEAGKFEYDAFDRLKYKVNPDGAAQSYRYDSFGNLTSIIDPMGGSIGFEYNNADYLTSLWDQGGKRTYYNYDANGNQISYSNPLAGKGAEFRYDDMNRLIQKISDNTASYEYDAGDNLSRIKDNTGETVYEYDAMDRLVKKSFPFAGAAYERKFDKAGNIVYEKQINGDEFIYEYDKADKLSAVTKKGAGTVQCKYNQGQDLAAIEFPNGVTEFVAYDGNKNIVKMKYLSSKTGVVIYEVNYGYDALDRIISKKESSSDQKEKEITYTYDKAGRLTQVSADGDVISEYTYDKNGNRLSSRTLRGIAQYSYDGANRLLTMSKSAYEYDEAGNLISESAGEETKTYQYDKENNLKTVKITGANKKANEINYEYSADNIRISKSSSANSDKTFACWFGGQLLGEVDKNGKAEFINYGYGFKDGTGDYYYITDIQGSVVGVTDKNGKIVTAYKYDEFGNPVATINAAEEPKPSDTASPAVSASPTPSKTPQKTQSPLPAITATPGKHQFPINYVPQPISSSAAPLQPQAQSPQKQSSSASTSGGARSSGGTSPSGTSGGGTSGGGTAPSASQTQSSPTPTPYNENLYRTPTPTPEETKTPSAAPEVKQTPKEEQKPQPAKTMAKPPVNYPINYVSMKTTPAPGAKTPQAGKTGKPAAVPTASPTIFTPTPAMPYTPAPGQQPPVTPTPAISVTPSPAQTTPAVGVQHPSAGSGQVAAPEQKPNVVQKVINNVINFFKNLFGKKKTSHAGALLIANNFVKNLLAKDSIYKPVKSAGVAEFINSLFGGDKSGGGQSANVNKVESPIRFCGYYYDKDTGLYYVQSRYYDPETGRFTQADKISYDGGLNLYAYCDNDPVNYTDPWGTDGGKNDIEWMKACQRDDPENWNKWQEKINAAQKELDNIKIDPIAEKARKDLEKLHGHSKGLERIKTGNVQNMKNPYPSWRRGGYIRAGSLGKIGKIIIFAGAVYTGYRIYTAASSAKDKEDAASAIMETGAEAADPTACIPFVPGFFERMNDLLNQSNQAMIDRAKQEEEYIRTHPHGSGNGSGTGSGGVDTGGTATEPPQDSATPTPTPTPTPSETVPQIQYSNMQVVWKVFFEKRNPPVDPDIYGQSTGAVFVWKAVPGAKYYKIEFTCNAHHDGSWWCNWSGVKPGVPCKHSLNLFGSGYYYYASADGFCTGSPTYSGNEIRGTSLGGGSLQFGLAGGSSGSHTPGENMKAVNDTRAYYSQRFAGWTAKITAIMK